jgi:hypothetical protein
MQAIPYLTLKKYTELSRGITTIYPQGLPVKIILKITILLHIILCSDATEKNEEQEWLELLEKALIGCGWYEQAELENTTEEIRRHFANTVIFFANLLIKEEKRGNRFISKPSHLKTRIANIREGNKKIPS